MSCLPLSRPLSNPGPSTLINADIDAIIHRGEERTTVLNSKYEGLTFEDLANFKSEASVQQWEGEDFRSVCLTSLDQHPIADSFIAQTIELQHVIHAEA